MPVRHTAGMTCRRHAWTMKSEPVLEVAQQQPQREWQGSGASLGAQSQTTGRSRNAWGKVGRDLAVTPANP